MADDQNRQLPASERKIRKAREDGQVARSRDLAHLLTVGGGGALLVALMPALGERLSAILRVGLSFDARLLSRDGALIERLAELSVTWLLVLLPLGAVATALALGAGVASGGWNFTFKPLSPNFGKLNPISGLGQIVSGRRLGDLGKACLLSLVLGCIGAAYLWLRMPHFHDALAMPLPRALAHTASTLLSGLTLLVIALAVFAAIDVPLQRFMMARQLRMSHQEAKQEHKENEGNPEVKGRIRQRMREMSKKRMLQAVPTADLVVMNPTHFAVALKYQDGQMAAPRVVAKGADLLAFKIRDIAREHKVPVLQAPPLARALYTHTEVDQEIPARLFTAVAQVLAYVYRLRNALAGRGPMPPDLGAIEVPADLDPMS
ncbi:flagellar biosynthesis protein FlhB [Aquabacterium sp. OR-4]|uniref:flagellar biosynthesis protein FlhB n=1 Tax=Aquabacterium sp. OR-4 TaxID=2978127 RepID=UPI0021B437C9|nr:flagellar biosynthesis protein FlhB [Aquabacterium sp. OR-4]MDT7836538.1 flagellar biosynthesis protein FlhB [Aquabacterium sp. OR-4]